ncbi:MAG: hypothetical protein EKK45_24225 [Curvibacter sp.]|nr:MAG: hypothetical protein EKK45_24225 [Curvibacter sp.]
MKTLAALALFASSSVMAAGIYDGIYANQTAANEYLSVHTNGNQMIVTEYTIVPSNGSVAFVSVIGTIRPPTVPVWQLFNGTVNGSTANLTGQYPFNACAVSFTLNFTSVGLTATINSATNTAVGSASGANCAALPALMNGNLNYTKLF